MLNIDLRNNLKIQIKVLHLKSIVRSHTAIAIVFARNQMCLKYTLKLSSLMSGHVVKSQLWTPTSVFQISKFH